MKVVCHNDCEPHSSPDIRPDTWIRSMYFRDPNGIHLELAALTRPYGEGDVVHAPMDAKGARAPLKTLETA
jgi:hypothetical protein